MTNHINCIILKEKRNNCMRVPDDEISTNRRIYGGCNGQTEEWLEEEGMRA